MLVLLIYFFPYLRHFFLVPNFSAASPLSYASGLDVSTPFHSTTVPCQRRRPRLSVYLISHLVTIDVSSTGNAAYCWISQRSISGIAFIFGDNRRQIYSRKDPHHVAPPRAWSETVWEAKQILGTVRKHRQGDCRRKPEQYLTLSLCFSNTM